MAAEQFNTFVNSVPVASALAGSEKMPLVQGGVTKSCTPAQIAALAGYTAPTVVPLLNQGADYGATSVYTVPAQGTYRVSISFWTPTWDGGASNPNVDLYWTSPTGNTNYPSGPFKTMATITLNSSEAASGPQLGASAEIACQNGSNILIQVATGSPYGAATWSMLVTIERIA